MHVRKGVAASVALGGVIAAAAGSPASRASVPSCASNKPTQDGARPNSRVAFGAPERVEMFSARSGGRFPWFAKTGLLIRGPAKVTLRVPDDLRDSVRISGWHGQVGEDQIQGNEGGLRSATTAAATTTRRRCWTFFSGGLRFKGAHCVRLRIEGPGDRVSFSTFGLRRDCA